MNRADSKLWSSARTLADLGEMTARWLEGTVTEHPGWDARPEPETASLITVLAAMNRQGFVTLTSQPHVREPWTGKLPGQLIRRNGWYCQDAFVTFLCDDDGYDRALSLVPDSLMFCFARTSDPATDGYPVSWTDAGRMRQNESWAGQPIGPQDLAYYFDGCHEAALAEVLGAWQVSVIEPSEDSVGLLWPAMAELAGIVVSL